MLANWTVDRSLTNGDISRDPQFLPHLIARIQRDGRHLKPIMGQGREIRAEMMFK
jgi:hypothetical protein